MPVVKQVTYYSFSELSEQAQQRVIDKVREWDDLFLSDEESIIECFKERHPHIHNMDVRYSGFCSQGDGASFTGYIDGDWAINNLLIEQVNKAFGSLLRYRIPVTVPAIAPIKGTVQVSKKRAKRFINLFY